MSTVTKKKSDKNKPVIQDQGPRIATVHIVGSSPLMYGKQVFEDKLDEETDAQYEERTCLKKVHVDHEGCIGINPQAIKFSLEWAASWNNMKVPGGAGGKETFKRRFTAGVASYDTFIRVAREGRDLVLDDVEVQRLSVPSQGERGGKKRVVRNFPTLNLPWEATFQMVILDHAIDYDVFSKHIRTSGIFDGIGSMRIRNGGPNGRYDVKSVVIEPLVV